MLSQLTLAISGQYWVVIVSMPVRALGSFLPESQAGNGWQTEAVSMPVRALGSFLLTCGDAFSGDWPNVVIVSMPVRALGSFLPGTILDPIGR